MFRMRGRQVAVLIVGGLAVLVLASVVAYVLTRLGSLTPADGAGFLALMALLPMSAILFWAYGWTLAVAEAPAPYLGLDRLRLRWAAVGVGGGIAVAALSWAVVTLTSRWLGAPFNLFLEILGKTAEVSLPLVVVLLLVGSVLAPLWEEIVFRGVLYTWARRHFGVGLSAIGVACLHALMHVDPAVLPALVTIFTVFALLYEWSGNIWVPILAHVTNNTLSFIWVFWQLG
jgi:membrane protease YdiL (CAAX protease family)